MNFLKIAKERGYYFQSTSNIASLFNGNKKITAYIGFDCTAPSLHVGSLIQIMIMRLLKKCGHNPIVLIGGGTTKIGDPSGKDKTRNILDSSAIEINKKSIVKIFSHFFTDIKIVDNSDWLDEINYMDFLRDYGKYFSINHMLTMESVKQRLDREQHLSFLEFNYMLLQAYDFVEMRRQYDCDLQIGGSDQWGNIVSGIDLHRRINECSGEYLHGFTTPLLVTASGVKMGKSEKGAIWLNPDMFSSYDYWQFWRNIEDADVGRFLRLFTELPLDEIERLEILDGAEINEAKKILATEATALLHGQSKAINAMEAAEKLFKTGKLSGDLPEFIIDKVTLETGIPAYKLFFLAGLTKSGKEARRLIIGGGAKVDDVAIDDENTIFGVDIANAKLSAGKKKHLILRIR